MTTIRAEYTVEYRVVEDSVNYCKAFFTDQVSLKDFIDRLEKEKIAFKVLHWSWLAEQEKFALGGHYTYWLTKEQLLKER